MAIFSIAIDGPAGAGKSTIAKEIAKKLECTYIDTGAMYRTVGYYCIKKGIDYTDETLVSDAMAHIHIDLRYEGVTQRIFLNGEDVSEAIRTQEVATSASKVATFSKVREALVAMQRGLQTKQSIVMDGRDIGTVVLPNATLKIFLTASAQERAKRRLMEYEGKGIVADFQTLLEEIKQRDHQDSTREVSPLCQATDAIAIDTTCLSIDAIVERIIQLLEAQK
ncbi:MAG: (d)CMP kinase [Cellulosilyticaceae bacterium]